MKFPISMIYGLPAILLWGISYFLGKIATNYMLGSSTKIYLFIGSIVSTIYAFSLTGFQLPPHYRAGGIAIVGGLLTAFATLFLYIGLNSGGKASVLVPLTSLYPLVSFLLGYMLLHERVTYTEGGG